MSLNIESILNNAKTVPSVQLANTLTICARDTYRRLCYDSTMIYDSGTLSSCRNEPTLFAILLYPRRYWSRGKTNVPFFPEPSHP